MTQNDKPNFPLWHQRVAVNADGRLDEESFIKLADQFISLVNKSQIKGAGN